MNESESGFEPEVVPVDHQLAEYRPRGSKLDPVPEEVAITASLFPWPHDDERSRYFGYMALGFSVREALNVIDRSKSWLSECRKEVKFQDMEARLPDVRKQLRKEFVEIMFFRNFGLALEKDYQVLKRSLGLERDSDNQVITMSHNDHQYLLKMRSQYTPEQIRVLEFLVQNQNGFNFTQWAMQNQDVVQMSRTDTLTMKRRQEWLGGEQ